MLISLFVILLCIVMLCAATYAWFSSTTVSDNNTLISGSFELEVFVVGELSTQPEPVISVQEGTTTCTFSAAGKYVVTLMPTAASSVKGYCVVEANGVTYNTDVIISAQMTNTDGFEPNTPYVILLDVASADVTVTFRSHWGIPVSASLMADSTLVVGGPDATEEN